MWSLQKNPTHCPRARTLSRKNVPSSSLMKLFTRRFFASRPNLAFQVLVETPLRWFSALYGGHRLLRSLEGDRAGVPATMHGVARRGRSMILLDPRHAQTNRRSLLGRPQLPYCGPLYLCPRMVNNSDDAEHTNVNILRIKIVTAHGNCSTLAGIAVPTAAPAAAPAGPHTRRRTTNDEMETCHTHLIVIPSQLTISISLVLSTNSHSCVLFFIARHARTPGSEDPEDASQQQQLIDGDGQAHLEIEAGVPKRSRRCIRTPPLLGVATLVLLILG